MIFIEAAVDKIREDVYGRWYSIMTYLSEPVIEYVLTIKMNQIECFGYIYHDKDTKEDGTLIEPHYHVLIKTYVSRFMSQVRNWFPSSEAGQDYVNTMIEPVVNKKKILDYLTHEDKPNKYHYDKEQIISRNLSSFCEENNKSFELVHAILEGETPTFLLKRFGREYVLNYQKYEDFIKNKFDNNIENFERDM